ncbi:hypothetical protein [Microbacterium terricola]|uniref:Uncharacterized protein n=1 Tax=Microbacterium terricola TaxID=344163 RepID=A0ABM8DZD1_9MICO|nr:hypothetical protein [Microbacterium terricola]UYK41306.1 hypothetical protein OAU46_06655 [Microbacterium terricola]BDV30912.1 hypothetical protein Microterr_15720 [Microbacterium terricola]
MDSYMSSVAYAQAERRTLDLVRDRARQRSQAERGVTIAPDPPRVSARVRFGTWLRVHAHRRATPVPVLPRG